ncbi:MAG: YdeI/OmpD-associated family protein [Acidobacteria bacterium]|nr:YdeI/OmpD-associated family protein [Acidobacteriota bacterium]MCA1608675.1 YdeI/OmpD-associated family protein [Acidobacteriota bacterium]
MPKTQKSVKFSAVLESSGNGSGWHFIPVSRKIGEKFPTDGKTRRVVCTLNEGKSFQCALMPSGGDFFIMVNKGIRTELGILDGDIVQVSLLADTSKYGMPMPDELEEVMNQDPEGHKLFHALTAGGQRSLMWQASQGKDIDTRIQRALIVIQHLKDNDGKVDGEKLQKEFRRPTI